MSEWRSGDHQWRSGDHARTVIFGQQPVFQPVVEFGIENEVIYIDD